MKKLCVLALAAALLLAGCAAGQETPPSAPLPTPTPAASLFVPHPDPEPTPTPTPTSTPEPAPTPTPPAPAEPSQTVQPVEEEEGGYFDNALLVGDSIMEGIRQYAAVRRQEEELLGTAGFLTSTMGVSLADLVGDRELGVGFSYRGEERPLADIVADIAPRRVFLLLGLNDLAGDPDPSVETVVDRYARLIDSLQTACPGTEFIVITNPPKVASQWLPDYTANRSFGNRLIKEFVDALIQMCQERDVPYVDAYSRLADENGALPNEFCRDGYIHLNHQGAAVAVEALEDFAEGQP